MTEHSLDHRPLHGVLAEFETSERLLAATRAAHAAGYRQMDAYSPYHVEGLTQALGVRATRLPWLVLAGGLVGGLSGYLLQVYGNAINYPYNVGGRPLHSWPMFLPVTFELAILCAALAAVLGMLALNGLPRPHHPIFNAERFALASRDRFFLCIEARDPNFEESAVRAFLESVQPNEIETVYGT